MRWMWNSEVDYRDDDGGDDVDEIEMEIITTIRTMCNCGKKKK